MKGTWSEDLNLSFELNNYLAAGSRINTALDDNIISVTAIDNVLKNKKVSFIKMDVEGSEYQSLLGCQNTIKRYHPTYIILRYLRFSSFFSITDESAFLTSALNAFSPLPVLQSTGIAYMPLLLKYEIHLRVASASATSHLFKRIILGLFLIRVSSSGFAEL